MNRLKHKFHEVVKLGPAPLITETEGAEVGIIAYGSTDMAVREAVCKLEKDGIKVNYLRIRSFPFHREVRDFIAHNKRTYIVEMNRDAQMKTLLQAEVHTEKQEMIPILHYNGHPLVARRVHEAVYNHETSVR